MIEERKKIKTVGNYNPRTQQYEDRYVWEDDRTAVETPIDVRRVEQIGNWNPYTRKYEPRYRDDSEEGTE